MSNQELIYKKCKICGENIRSDAVYCTHCNNFQNWRSYLGVSSTFLSILVALISVLTVFVAVVADSAIKNDSDIDASIINWERSFKVHQGHTAQILVAEIFITNSGKKPGAIKSISVKGSSDKEYTILQSKIENTLNEYSNIAVESEIIEPGRSMILRRYLITYIDVDTFNKEYSNSSLSIEVINFSGINQNIETKVENRSLLLPNY